MQANYDDVLHVTIEILQQQEAIYSQHIKEVKAEMMTENDAVYTIDIQKLKQLNNLTTYLYEFISPFGFNRTQTENIVGILDNESGKMFYSSAYCLLKDRNSIQIKSIEKQAASIVIEDRFANNKMQEYRLLLERLPYCQGFEIEDRAEVAYFDADKIEFPLLVRKWKEGDVFFPFGMKGSKKLSDFFIDNKMSLFEKQEIDLLCNGNGDILWVIGKRSDNRYRLTTSSKTALKITYY
jgi:tRNA(Ile)-lysidine synthase